MTTTQTANAYTVLGVSPLTSPENLKQAYRRLIRDAHPDRGGVAAKFDAIQKAWNQISTPEKRAAYDQAHLVNSAPRSSQTSTSSSPNSTTHTTTTTTTDAQGKTTRTTTSYTTFTKAEDFTDLHKMQAADAYERAKMRDIDEKWRRQREYDDKIEAVRLERMKMRYAETSKTKRRSLFSMDDHGIVIMLPQSMHWGAGLIFFMTTVLGLSLFFGTGIFNMTNFVCHLIAATIVTIMIIVGRMPSITDWGIANSGMRIASAAFSAFGFCLVGMVVTLLRNSL